MAVQGVSSGTAAGQRPYHSSTGSPARPRQGGHLWAGGTTQEATPSSCQPGDPSTTTHMGKPTGWEAPRPQLARNAAPPPQIWEQIVATRLSLIPFMLCELCRTRINKSRWWLATTSALLLGQPEGQATQPSPSDAEQRPQRARCWRQGQAALKGLAPTETRWKAEEKQHY